MTKPLEATPAQAYPMTHMLFRGLFFAAVLLVGGAVLGFLGWRIDLMVFDLLRGGG